MAVGVEVVLVRNVRQAAVLSNGAQGVFLGVDARLSHLADSAALKKRLEEERSRLQQFEIIIPDSDNDNAALPSAETNPSATPTAPTISAPIDRSKDNSKS
ncbi:hypothetical protein HDV05_003290 [Chytridiales sp. JEL 0842]|nr:hypothetical protein HDV05_003290 [Chytridiales sp. JEL 0842]